MEISCAQCANNFLRSSELINCFSAVNLAYDQDHQSIMPSYPHSDPPIDPISSLLIIELLIKKINTAIDGLCLDATSEVCKSASD